MTRSTALRLVSTTTAVLLATALTAGPRVVH
jgi:hypothetical protein